MAVEVESPWVIGLVSGLVVALLSPILQSLFQHYVGRRQRLFELKNEVFSGMVDLYGRLTRNHTLFKWEEEARLKEGREEVHKTELEWEKEAADCRLEADRLDGLISVFFSEEVHQAYMAAISTGFRRVGGKEELREYVGKRTESIRAMAQELGLGGGGPSWVQSMALSCSSRTKAMFGYLARWWGRVYQSRGPC